MNKHRRFDDRHGVGRSKSTLSMLIRRYRERRKRPKAWQLIARTKRRRNVEFRRPTARQTDAEEAANGAEVASRA